LRRRRRINRAPRNNAGTTLAGEPLPPAEQLPPPSSVPPPPGSPFGELPPLEEPPPPEELALVEELPPPDELPLLDEPPLLEPLELVVLPPSVPPLEEVDELEELPPPPVKSYRRARARMAAKGFARSTRLYVPSIGPLPMAARLVGETSTSVRSVTVVPWTVARRCVFVPFDTLS
jgi:hypothetical protein